jgi:hypothetical protein
MAIYRGQGWVMNYLLSSLPLERAWFQYIDTFETLYYTEIKFGVLGDHTKVDN